MPRSDGRKACVSALRKHVCAALIEGRRERGEGKATCLDIFTSSNPLSMMIPLLPALAGMAPELRP